ncbi:uncharacterized protein LOC129943877 [Eupeodes corollae]|uniref:uncharacterized protein LOC129943877 n=1 Tax=Eupeodes corollae TaxID=290404 RepID=UPI002491DAA0|nr:uncharacterized protein LOC129943877 [Eupeodes corollae]
MRIVWDAAATVEGVSLNSFLLKGPDQLTSLVSVMFKFREEKIAIYGDIMEMFHQIRIRKEDQSCQRFLWSRSSEESPVVYAMTVMTFGASCSPCCAQYTKNINADYFVEKFPRAVQSIQQNHYVYDLMDSVATEEEAINIAKQIRYIHQQGGFYIRNWISNSPVVLQALQSELTESKNLNFDVELTTEKVLGMWWSTSNDSFTYKLTKNAQQREVLFDGRRPTKREVLKILMTIFDPLGLLAHFLMFVKILLQDIWRSKIDWDTAIQDPEFEKWLKWVHLLPAVENLNIPRCYMSNATKDTGERQLHIFVDASENGFAAVAYVRSSYGNHVECALIGAKTRVAPLKNVSIPRLELQAAILGARFAKSVIDSHTLNFSQRVFWSDSRNVLSWLRSDHRRYRQYVACRVSKILDLTDVKEWRWVPTKVNVADEATIWKSVPEFSSKSRWFNGPEFLKLSSDNWPKEVCSEDTTVEELKTQYMNVHVHVKSQENILQAETFSCWNRLLRSTAYIIRYMNNLKIKKEEKCKRTSGILKREELKKAWYVLMREAQHITYQEELADLISKRLLEKSSPIYNLCPYLDDHNIIRAKGRIDLSIESNDDFKRPIILPRDHQITYLIMMDMHYRFHHQNHETAINEIRQTYQIPQLRTAFHSMRKKCQDCKNQNAKPREPMMAQLPKARLSPFTRPFSFTGIDYFGPINISILRRSEKRWGVLLTCLTTRAVHIEIAHSLSAYSCILALRNFMARRGAPIEIFSDNGTNFQGAERELREALNDVDKLKLMEAFTSPRTKWSFNPISSPHMEGCWERLVRSIKTVLYKIMPMRNPTDELLRSMMLEVENIVNSRPLTYIPIDSENEEALTPNHFLLGSSNGMKPLVVFGDDVKVVRKNWQTSQQYADHFWKRWVSEYLPTITRRSKWFAPVDPIKEGDIVLIVDQNSPRNCWLKGRVIQTKVAKDGQVRSATVFTRSGIYIRPSVKLAVLDVTTSAGKINKSGHTKGESKILCYQQQELVAWLTERNIQFAADAKVAQLRELYEENCEENYSEDHFIEAENFERPGKTINSDLSQQIQESVPGNEVEIYKEIQMIAKKLKLIELHRELARHEEHFASSSSPLYQPS